MSITFNGTSNYLELASDLIGAGVNEAFFAWIRPRGVSLSGNSAAVSAGRFGAGSELSMITIGGASVRAQSRDGTGSAVAEQSRTLSDTWFACMVVFTSTTSRTVYISGASSVSNTDSNDARLPGVLDRFRIGARGYEDNLYFEGDIAEVAVWSGTLPDATDFTSLAGGAEPETIKSGSLIWHRQLLTHTDLTTGGAGADPTANGALSTGATHPITRSTSAELTGSITLADLEPTGTLGLNAAALTGSITLDAITPTGTLGIAPGSVTTFPFSRNTGSRPTGLTGVALAILSDDANLTRLAGATSIAQDGAGRLTYTGAGLPSVGTSVLVVTREPDGKLGLERYTVA